MGTEMRNKMWENDNKNMLNSYTSSSMTMSSSASPLLDQSSIDSTQSDSSYSSTNLKSPNGIQNVNGGSLTFNNSTSGANLNKFVQNQATIPVQARNGATPPSTVQPK